MAKSEKYPPQATMGPPIPGPTRKPRAHETLYHPMAETRLSLSTDSATMASVIGQRRE